ncbi:MAG TPA: hypothetical protein PLL53_20920, partial [Saprospiraceae bacterium]|nr:hypothetical protein [Saprospiraceae bacterium]
MTGQNFSFGALIPLVFWLICSGLPERQHPGLPQTALAQSSGIQADDSTQAGSFLSPDALVVAFCPGFALTYNAASNGSFGMLNIGGGVDLVGAVGSAVNATGYNSQDGNLYAVRGSDQHVLRLNMDGTFNDLGGTTIPAALNIVVGGFDEAGNYYVKDGNNPEIYRIDISTLNVTTINPSGLFFAKDWAFHPDKGKFYGVHASNLYSFDPSTLIVEIIPLTGILGGEGATFGASMYAADGYIYVISNSTGNIYRVDVDENEAHFVLTFSLTATTGTDGASCITAMPPFPVVCAHKDTVCLSASGSTSYPILANDMVHLTTFNLSSFTVLTPPASGSVSFNPGNGQLTYTPSGAPVADAMTYRICGTGSPTVCDYATVYFLAPVSATFSSFGPYCSNQTPAALPSVSNNGVSGSWSPSSINTSNLGVSTYTFTPDPALYP